jgi:hypothetical protein
MSTDYQTLAERRGEEITRAMAHVGELEAQMSSLVERVGQVDYWMQRAKRAEAELATVRVELAKAQMEPAEA